MTTPTPPEANQAGEQPLSNRAVRLAAALEEWPRRTLNLEELWAAWDIADPASAGRASRRKDLHAALTALADAHAVTLSRTTDTTALPALPTRVSLPAPEATPTAAALASQTAWRPELDWVIDTRLTLAQIQRLRAVNAWLRENASGVDVMPLRERSLQIFGQEKVLDALLATSLFGSDRLTLDMLRTFRTHPPLPSRHVGPGDVLLVVENEDTFHTLWNALIEDPGPVGYIAWGAGAAFEASVRSTGDLPSVRRTVYFGDVDAAGLRIPSAAAATATREKLPPVTPANVLYRMLMHHSRPQGGTSSVAADQSPTLTGWLADPELEHHASLLLAQGHRLAQEAVTRLVLSETPAWQSQL